MFKVEVDIEDQRLFTVKQLRKLQLVKENIRNNPVALDNTVTYLFVLNHILKTLRLNQKVGGAVPKGYFPAVEKGLIETFEHGPLAGFPVINVKASYLMVLITMLILMKFHLNF